MLLTMPYTLTLSFFLACPWAKIKYAAASKTCMALRKTTVGTRREETMTADLCEQADGRGQQSNEPIKHYERAGC